MRRLAGAKEEELRALSEEDLKGVLLEMGLKPPGTKKEMIDLILFEQTKIKQSTDPGGGGGEEGEEEAVNVAEVEADEEMNEREEKSVEKKEDVKRPDEKEEEEIKEAMEKEKDKEAEKCGEAEKDSDKKSELDDAEKMTETSDPVEINENSLNVVIEDDKKEEINNNNNNERGDDKDNDDIDMEKEAESNDDKKEEKKEDNDDDIFNIMAESPNKIEVIDDDVYSSGPVDIDESNVPSESTTLQNDTLKEEEGEGEMKGVEEEEKAEESVEAKSCIVHVSGFVRPFSTQDAEELFTRCGGAYNYYWMNRIKSLAYVSYKTEEDAARAIKEMDGMALQNGTKAKLTAKFGDESVAIRAIQNDAKVNRSPLAVRLVKEFREKGLIVPETAPKVTKASPSTKEENGDDEKESVTPSKRSLNDGKEEEGEEEGESDAQPQKKKKKANARLDELFMKTKCEPHLYYLPLTDQEVAERDKARKEKRKKEKGKEDSK